MEHFLETKNSKSKEEKKIKKKKKIFKMTLKILYDIPEHRMRDAIKSYTIELKNSNTIKDPVFVNFCKKLLEKRTKFFEKETPENFSWLSQHRYILNDSTIII